MIEREQFQMDDDTPASAFEWRFDLCQLTLANFNARKMSLVRDYHELLRADRANAGFDLLFSTDPRPQTTPPPAAALHAQTTVIAADPTQAQAVALARQKQSFIIQGPPGTGKSQTIVNLIADYLARGQRVLFVAEKRAAIDVVFHRLGQQGLAKLCALIHDSQADKKTFVMDLKAVYEGWLADKSATDTARQSRDALASRVQGLMARLQAFDEAMQQPHPSAGAPLKTLCERRLLLGVPQTALSAEASEIVPHYAAFAEGSHALRALETRIADAAAPALSQLALRHLQAALLESPQPISTTQKFVADLGEQLAGVEPELRDWPLPVGEALQLARIEQFADLLHALEPLNHQGHTALLDVTSLRSQTFAALSEALRKSSAHLADTESKTGGWKTKPTPDDTRRLSERLGAMETSFLRWLNPEFYKLKKLVDLQYDFTRHAVRPRYAELLRDLGAEHEAASACKVASEAVQQQFFTSDAAALAVMVEQLRAQMQQLPRWLLPVLDACKSHGAPRSHAALVSRLRNLLHAANGLLCNSETWPLGALSPLLADLRTQLPLLPALAAPLAALNQQHGAPGSLAYAVRQLTLPADELERLSLLKTFAALELEWPQLRRFDAGLLRQTLDELDQIAPQLRTANAETVLEAARQRFQQHVATAAASQAGKSAPDKDWARRYQAGRRELENEFGKMMRYKAIRELASHDSGLVVRDLKPVWMMSPLAISDTLPLVDDAFDVVIFDEASQIPVEDAGPSLYRAAQTIIVGDEMQLPPTQFFTSGGSDDDSEGVEELASDSLLSQAARQFPATLLGWHYRSRSETLISFSNHLFYEGRLLTVPDAARSVSGEPLKVQRPADAATLLPLALARPVSFHAIEQGVYDNRRNAKEAAYIAEQVRTLLLADSPLTIGVVAFSEAQQGEIEAALSTLAATDTDFAVKLEAAYEREEDGQFCGLIVKNLENVQGDERDLVIMSVCYGHDRNGRMLMNFGPINQAGGEKRLNVVFSRAKKHLFLVTSITHADIKNDYNPGAAALKTYLRYAEALSQGQRELADASLRGGAAMRSSGARDVSALTEPLADAITAALVKQGFVVERGIGSSSFRVDLAVRRADDAHHRLGILLDSHRHYAESNLAERYWQKPGLLYAFGWQVTTVLHKDWLADEDLVMQQLCSALAIHPPGGEG